MKRWECQAVGAVHTFTAMYVWLAVEHSAFRFYSDSVNSEKCCCFIFQELILYPSLFLRTRSTTKMDYMGKSIII